MAASKTKKKILIAEDEPALRHIFVLKLENSGFEVHSAENGQQALDILAKEKFDLLILDLIMPEKSGFDVLEELQRRKNKMPVIVASNLSQDEDLERAKQFGIKDYFVKSHTSVATVVDNIKKILGA